MSRTIAGTTINSYVDTKENYLLRGTIDNLGSGIDTTAGRYAPGAEITDLSTGLTYRNTGTTALPVWSRVGGSGTLDPEVLQFAEVDISSANITGTSAGQLGHANGVVLVAAPATGYFLELVSVTMSYTFATAQYTGGGNITVNESGGGAAKTGLVSFANSIGNAASKILQFVPLSTVANPVTKETGLALVAASAPTQPGTAGGTIKCFVTYRVHAI